MTASQNSRQPYRPGIFLSYPKPCHTQQEDFIERVYAEVEANGFIPRTLGVNEYSMHAPLAAIRRIMIESNGLITVGFRRIHMASATGNYQADVPGRAEYDLSGQWLTSPWSHIEPAMAYQIGLPVLILREQGVVADGMLERGSVGQYMPEFSVTDPLDDYFSSPEWKSTMAEWAQHVRNVITRKGQAPQLY